MNDLLVRIISLVENILILPIIWLFPIKWTIVIPGSSAIRFTLGKPSIDLRPGIHFATTGQTLHNEHINTRLAVAESMYVLTEDGVPLRIRGVAIYKILSLAKYLTASDNSDEFITEACEAAIRHAISYVPFEDLVKDSDTVEETISTKIAEICYDFGITIKRYRFQDIEFTDPIGRCLSTIKAMEPNLTAAAKHMANSLGISHQNALIVLSPNIQFVSNITANQESELGSTQEEDDESE